MALCHSDLSSIFYRESRKKLSFRAHPVVLVTTLPLDKASSVWSEDPVTKGGVLSRVV